MKISNLLKIISKFTEEKSNRIELNEVTKKDIKKYKKRINKIKSSNLKLHEEYLSEISKNDEKYDEKVKNPELLDEKELKEIYKPEGEAFQKYYDEINETADEYINKSKKIEYIKNYRKTVNLGFINKVKNSKLSHMILKGKNKIKKSTVKGIEKLFNGVDKLDNKSREKAISLIEKTKNKKKKAVEKVEPKIKNKTDKSKGIFEKITEKKNKINQRINDFFEYKGYVEKTKQDRLYDDLGGLLDTLDKSGVKLSDEQETKLLNKLVEKENEVFGLKAEDQDKKPKKLEEKLDKDVELLSYIDLNDNQITEVLSYYDYKLKQDEKDLIL